MLPDVWNHRLTGCHTAAVRRSELVMYIRLGFQEGKLPLDVRVSQYRVEEINDALFDLEWGAIAGRLIIGI
jgi:Zn-dependent alcohol dehydrogenase